MEKNYDKPAVFFIVINALKNIALNVSGFTNQVNAQDWNEITWK